MPKVESIVPVPARSDGPRLADWAESILLLEDRRLLSRSYIRSRLENALYEGELDPQIELLFREVVRRRRIVGSGYPFVKTDRGVERQDATDETAYEFLLWLSVSPKYRDEGRFGEIDILFDKLVKQALVNYLGPGALGVRFAFPSSDGRPKNFPDALEWMADQLNMPTGSLAPRPATKDGGADVIAWRPFKDGKAGYSTIICQCTAQLNWTLKAKDVIASLWAGWISFGVAPMTALAVPFALGSSFDKWDEIRYIVNIVLDRLRLCELLGATSPDEKTEIQQWNARERGLLVAAV
jgi:hypothetical protein